MAIDTGQAKGLFDLYATGYTPDQAALDFWGNKIATSGYDAALNEFLKPAQGSAAPRATAMYADPDYIARMGGSTTAPAAKTTADYFADIMGQASGLGPAVYDETGKLISGTPFKSYDATTAAAYGDIAKNLVAGPTAEQTAIFKGLGNLTTPSGFAEAASALKGLTGKTVSFNPTEFTSSYKALADYTPAQIKSMFESPEAYQTAEAVLPKEFNLENLQQYINPYLQLVLDPQLAETRRQADIDRTAMQARLAKAGAYGGSRQAVLEAEAQRNLQQELSKLTGKGLYDAYQDAGKRFNDAFQRELDSAKFVEDSRQFGYTQAVEIAKAKAASDLEAQKANELSRQFGYGEKSKAASEAARISLEAQKASDLSRKYGADVGIANLQAQAQAAQALANAARSEGEYGLSALKAKADISEQQRKIEQEQKDAAYKQFLREQSMPYDQLKFVSDIASKIPGLGTMATTPGQTDYEAGVKGIQDALALLKTLKLIPDA
jgi:hypothetical protein